MWRRPPAATCGHSGKAATRGHLRPLGKSGHLRPLSGCEWLQVAAFYEIETPRPRVEGGHLRSLAATRQSGHLRPLEWLRVAASGFFSEIQIPRRMQPQWKQIKTIKSTAFTGEKLYHTLVFQNPPVIPCEDRCLDPPKDLQKGGVCGSFCTDTHKVFGRLGKFNSYICFFDGWKKVTPKESISATDPWEPSAPRC